MDGAQLPQIEVVALQRRGQSELQKEVEHTARNGPRPCGVEPGRRPELPAAPGRLHTRALGAQAPQLPTDTAEQRGARAKVAERCQTSAQAPQREAHVGARRVGARLERDVLVEQERCLRTESDTPGAQLHTEPDTQTRMR